MFDPRQPAPTLTLRISLTIAGILAATVLLSDMSRPPTPLAVRENGQTVLETCLISGSPIDRENLSKLIGKVNSELQGTLSIRIVDASTHQCSLTVLLSATSPWAGKSGLTIDGRNLTVINPRLANVATLMDELGHQLRGHVRLPRMYSVVRVPLNVWLDTSNQLWWIGVKTRLWSVPSRSTRPLPLVCLRCLELQRKGPRLAAEPLKLYWATSCSPTRSCVPFRGVTLPT
jgi:hypothetical protein